MYSSKDAANPSYPTQWALNPTAYQNVDSSDVDWAALAQQWIAMKEAAAVMAAPPPPSMKPDAEEGEAPMEVESNDNNDSSISPGAEWNASTNSWGGSGWNQWGWGWPGSDAVDPKMAPDPSIAIPSLMDGFIVPPDTPTQMPGYTTGPVPAPTFQHGYWTAPQPDQAATRSNNNNRDRRSKSKNRDHKPTRPARPPREKVAMVPPVAAPMPMAMPGAMQPTTTIDAAKRRQLPAWIREGLEKMEREKQRAIEREQEIKARELADIEKKKLEEQELERMKAEAGGQPVMPAKSKFDSDSEGEEMEKAEPPASSPAREESPESEDDGEPVQPFIKKTKEEIMQEIMLAVRRSLTEILLEVTDSEIHTVSQEEYNRYTAAQASRLNALKASKSKALAAIASGLGLGAYESSSEGSGDEDEQNDRDISDQQLQDIIRRKKIEFERTAREIEAEVRRAEAREVGEDVLGQRHAAAAAATPDKPRRTSRSSATPPPIDNDATEKIPQRITKDRRTNHKSTDKVDGRKLETIIEEKHKKTKKEHTPSPSPKEQSSTSDSDDDSSTSSSSSSIENKDKRKRKRRSSSDSLKKKKDKRKKSHKEEKRYYEERSKGRKKESERERHKSSYDRHRDKYREDSEEERPRKRSRRSRSVSYESRSSRRRSHRSRDRDHDRYDRDRDRDHDRYDRDRDRDRDRRRTRSPSHHRHRR